MENWRDHAACRTEDPELFFPIGTSGPAVMQAEQAKRVCGGCPVREQCLRWALDAGDCLGVWGGTDENERRALRARKRRQAARAAQG
ncbi:WhiB family transcriptional regulator [Streptomyces sp. MAA16]|uniref:WhiB family transcriptional regulator n=1 Tax=Streptomyces sp. MAA16 TaxID=3035116 RepID=UPI0024733224|nr:WhiB family transcriptional regulator [Streptomyces sp. MAA16]MDH6697916.1 WhiB family redox-sensing transcriptional regulator [Streptomyces sp. MAA16]